MRSEWTRKRVTLATTVAAQATYDLPASFDRAHGERILEVTVNGTEYSLGDAETVRNLNNGDQYLRGSGIYYTDWDEEGNETITVYPAPSSDGLTISALCVMEPDEMEDGADEPWVPARFRWAIVDYAAAKAFGADEDNPEMRAFYEQEFDRKAAELTMLRYSREGRKAAQMQVEGVHF